MKQCRQEKISLLETMTAIYAACMLSVFLLFPGTGGYRSITAEKWRAFLLLSGGYAALMLLLRLELALAGSHRLSSPAALWRSMGVPQKLLIGFWMLSAVSTAFSVDRTVSFWGGARHEGLLTITLYCAVCLLVSRYGRARAWMLGLFGAAMSVNCLLSFLQLAGYNPLGLYPRGMNFYDANVLYTGEFLGTAGNVDIFSAILCAAIPAFWIAVVKLPERRRFFFLIPLVLCMAVLWKISVAGGIVGVIGSALLTVPVLLRGKRARAAGWTAVLCVLVLGAAGIYAFGGQLGGFLREASELLHGRWNDDFGSGRLYIWRNVAELIRERPLWGGGPDTLGLRTAAAFERYDELLGLLIHSSVDAAHNEYLNIAVNQGLLALLTYMAALFTAAAGWARTAAEDPASAICGGAVLGYCIQAFFGISSPISAPYLWLALGFLMSSVSVRQKRRAWQKNDRRTRSQ